MLVVVKERSSNEDANVQGGEGRGLSYLPGGKNVETLFAIVAIMILA
jgi:hypothetical protein